LALRPSLCALLRHRRGCKLEPAQLQPVDGASKKTARASHFPQTVPIAVMQPKPFLASMEPFTTGATGQLFVPRAMQQVAAAPKPVAIALWRLCR